MDLDQDPNSILEKKKKSNEKRNQLENSRNRCWSVGQNSSGERVRSSRVFQFIHIYISTKKEEKNTRRRRRRRSADKTIDKSVSTARIPIASSARLTRCLYRGMYNNRLRRWHRCPFVSVGGHLGFSSRGRIRELDRGKVARERRERGEELLDGRRARFEEEVEKKIRMRMRSEGLGRGDVLIGIGDG